MDFLRSQPHLLHTILLLLLWFGVSTGLHSAQANVLTLDGGIAYLNADDTEVRVVGEVSLHPRPNTQYETIDIILEDTNARIAHLSAAIARHAQFTLPHSDQYAYSFNPTTARVEIRHAGALMLSLPVNRQGEAPSLRIQNGVFVRIRIEQDGLGGYRLVNIPHSTEPPPATTTGRLNDTGIDWCADGSSNNLQCPVAGFPNQDGDHGRDALARQGQLQKIGAGAAGFDYTKLDANGRPLAIQNMPWSDGGNETDGTRWSCVQDNVTGLIWEVKVNEYGHLRSGYHTFSWYNPDPNTNGGNAGIQDGGNCVGSVCDTRGYVQAVNAQGLCGATDWRLPTRVELASLIHAGRFDPAIDTDYFPDSLVIVMMRNIIWSSSPNAGDSGIAWGISGGSGHVFSFDKDSANSIRLVRVQH